jgi:hypothetical protein
LPANGVFTWYDAMSTDPAATRAFYSALFGWSVTETGGPLGASFVFACGGVPVAGLIPLDPDLGYPTHWLSYVSAADVEATAGRAMAMGGAVLHPPADIPGVGRFTVLADPEGSLLGVIRLFDPPAADRRAMGGFAWNEVLCPDEGVRRFYAGVFGYAVVPLELGPIGTYWLFEADGAEQAGLSRADDAIPGYWLPYVRVPDVDAAVAAARVLGAKVRSAAMTLPKLGRFAVLEDPLGAPFGVIG